MNSRNAYSNHVESEYRPFNFEAGSNDQLSDQSQSTAADECYRNPFHLEQQLDSLPATPSPAPPPVVPFAPTPPYASTDATSDDLYGPDRLFGPPLVAPTGFPPHSQARPTSSSLPPAVALPPTSFNPNPRFVRFDEAQLEMDAREAALNQSMLTGFRDELVREAGVVTPGVDDTPSLQYALEAITKEASNPTITPHSSGESYSFPSPRPVYQQHRVSVPLQPAAAVGTSVLNSHQPPRESGIIHAVPIASQAGPERLAPPPRPSSLAATLTPDPRTNDDELPDRHSWTPFEPWHKPHVLPLTYKPALLRSASLACAVFLPLLMAALIIACAVYSMQHTGLADYGGTIYGYQWFIFRILPQLLALFIIIFAQAIVSTAHRMQPFRMLASDTDEVRQGAFIRHLYTKSFLYPNIDGSWDINIPVVLIWAAHFTIPLQSSLFTVVLLDGTWRWAIVQGVAWAVVALYFLLTAAFIVLFVAWRRAETGLLWDPVSLADMISLFSRTNNTTTFDGLDGAANKSAIAHQLGSAVDRLTWWHDRNQPRGGRWWYSLGLSGNAHPVRTGLKRTKYVSSNETLHDEKGAGEVGAWYLPWYLRTSQLLAFIVTAGIVIIVIFVISFLKMTSLANGFLPSVEAAPTNAAFSPANFLWSFFPSLLGLVLWLLWLSLENKVRVLTPWAELSKPEGADAKTSLLVDYAATPFPLLVTFKAARNGHWRMAALSLLSATFAFLPVLGGGLFMALTRLSDGAVRMHPNFPAYGVLLAVLVLYFLGLVSLIPDRQRMRLPHSVDSLGEIYSFCLGEEFLSDPAFRTTGDFDNIGQFTGREKRGMMVEELARGKGEKRFVFQRENGRWGIVGSRKFTGGESLGMARRMRGETRTKALRAPEFWGRRGSELGSQFDDDDDVGRMV